MILKCLGSSSDGNCFILENDNEALIIEAGINFNEVKKSLRWNVRKVVGCIVTHQHKDHAKSVLKMLKTGIRVLALDDVFKSFSLSSRAFCEVAVPHHGYILGNFKVFAFDVVHDVPCLGFIVEHIDIGRLLFVTDTMMLQYKFPKLNHILLECNYCDKILDESINEGLTPSSTRGRLLQTHMELETTKGVLKANDLSQVREIVLLHLSSRHAYGSLFKQEIESTCGKPTYIAHNGLEIELSRM